MRKIFFSIIIALAFSLCACSGGTAPESVSQTETSMTETAQTAETAQAAEPTTAAKGNPGGNTKSASRDIFAMDTYMTVTCFGERCEEAADAAETEIRRLDSLLSVGNEESEISRINRTGEGTLSVDSGEMIEEALELFKNTGGAFDITVYPLMQLWGFTTQDFSVPADSDREEVLSHVGSSKLLYEDGVLKLNGAEGIDLGGIAKGYTSDRLMDIFADYNLTSGLISLGGNVELYGTKPDGSLWKCGIQDPHKAEDGTALLGILEAKDCAVITSGAYERFFTDQQGNIYHHILDPKTGFPANNGLISVSIVSENGMLADGLSTACYVMGLEDAISCWRTYGDAFDMILMTEEDEVYITENLQDSFSTEYPLHVIHK